MRNLNFFFLIPTDAGVLGSGVELSVSNVATWAVLVRAGKAGHLDPLVRTLGENEGASWWKTTG